jgi:DNA-binding transcriptional MerR regulator
VRIGEVARWSGISAKTIRYYENRGVIDPPTRTMSGYRDYDADVLTRLTFIRSAQAIGLTLAEIREVIEFRERGETPCTHVLALIDEHRAEIDRCIDRLRDMKAALEILAERGQRLDPRECKADDVCHVIRT